jgi:hypothetical protein
LPSPFLACAQLSRTEVPDSFAAATLAGVVGA